MFISNLITPIKFFFSAGQYHITDKAGNHFYSTDSFLDALRTIQTLEQTKEELFNDLYNDNVEIPF